MDSKVDAVIGQEQPGDVNRFVSPSRQQQGATLLQPSSLLQYAAPEYAEEKDAFKLLNQKRSAVADILNTLLPPKEFRLADGQWVRQSASTSKAERDDVIRLQLELERRLAERQARDSGLCPVREQLYAQCFDELIRQATIERPERGLLLMRARDEIKMTIAAYQTLYKSSITFGLRKTLQAEQGNTEMARKIEDLQAQKKRLQTQLAEQRSVCETLEKRTAEKRAGNEKKMADEKEFLKFQAQHLESFLKSLQQQS